VIEGRLRMNTVTRQDGVKEKKAEFTLARLHSVGAAGAAMPSAQPANPSFQPSSAPAGGGRPAAPAPRRVSAPEPAAIAAPAAQEPASWNTSPLVPDLGDSDDEIPF
jgi:single-stranded DNA-binding protein